MILCGFFAEKMLSILRCLSVQINNFPAALFGKPYRLSRTAAVMVFIVVTQANVSQFHKPFVPFFHAVFIVVFRDYLHAVRRFKYFKICLFVIFIPTGGLFLRRTWQD